MSDLEIQQKENARLLTTIAELREENSRLKMVTLDLWEMAEDISVGRKLTCLTCGKPQPCNCS